jgi:hypothetical protein
MDLAARLLDEDRSEAKEPRRSRQDQDEIDYLERLFHMD